MTTLDVLQQARALISDPEHWTQGYWARRESRLGLVECVPDDPDAVCWCAAGAINKVAQARMFADPAIDTLELALPLDYRHRAAPIFAFNDERTHAEVLHAFDTAIARLDYAAHAKTPVPPPTGGLD